MLDVLVHHHQQQRQQGRLPAQAANAPEESRSGCITHGETPNSGWFGPLQWEGAEPACYLVSLIIEDGTAVCEGEPLSSNRVPGRSSSRRRDWGMRASQVLSSERVVNRARPPRKAVPYPRTWWISFKAAPKAASAAEILLRIRRRGIREALMRCAPPLILCGGPGRHFEEAQHLGQCL